MKCSYCGKKDVFARGLCQACYWRQRRTGQLARKNVVNSGRCQVVGCRKEAFAKNLCVRHYHRSAHPLKTIWKLLRSRYPGEFPPAWVSFEKFLADVGARPSPKHQLRRLDPAKPYSRRNVHWLAPIVPADGRKKALLRAEYQRSWRLTRRFGISRELYNKMLAEQGGVCAICGKKETHTNGHGRVKELSVDHNHKTRAVRGLLCVRCNRGIGYLDDDIERLNRAIAYLRRHTA